jgi:hypothetical protein
LIPDANQTSYSPKRSGSFALSISANGCTYFTNCQSIILSANEEISLEKIKIFPNPTFDILNIYLVKPGTIQVLNAYGSLIRSLNLNQGLQQIDVQELPTGTYFIKWSNKEEIKYIPFVKL